MEAIGCLAPELQSEMCRGCRTQRFEKTQCLYADTVNFNVSAYYHVMQYTSSCKKAAWKSEKTIRKDSGL